VSFLFKKYLSNDDLTSLATTIAEAEKNTSGEIRVVVRHRRRRNERKLSLHDLVLKEFYRLGMEKTRDRTGVLIMLLMSEHQFEIVADEGINAQVAEGTWDTLAARMSAHFREGKFRDGVAHAVRTVGEELAKHFPRKPDDTNELPDDIIVQ
jgi:uncharacterized membrane protein